MTAPGFQLDQDPLRNNMMAAAITILYVHLVIYAMAGLVNANKLPPFFSRKVCKNNLVCPLLLLYYALISNINNSIV